MGFKTKSNGVFCPTIRPRLISLRLLRKQLLPVGWTKKFAWQMIGSLHESRCWVANRRSCDLSGGWANTRNYATLRGDGGVMVTLPPHSKNVLGSIPAEDTVWCVRSSMESVPIPWAGSAIGRFCVEFACSPRVPVPIWAPNSQKVCKIMCTIPPPAVSNWGW